MSIKEILKTMFTDKEMSMKDSLIAILELLGLLLLLSIDYPTLILRLFGLDW